MCIQKLQSVKTFIVKYILVHWLIKNYMKKIIPGKGLTEMCIVVVLNTNCVTILTARKVKS
jgi:hypothetical protein